MNGLFRTGFRPLQIAPGRYLGQAPAPAPAPAPTPAPSPAPAQPVVVPGAPVVVTTPPATVVTSPGIPTGVWILGGLLMIGALAYFASSAARSPRRR